MQNNLTIGERISDLRTNRKLSQEAVAAAIGTSQSKISEYEDGKYNPDYEKLVKLADLFDVTLDYLLCRTDHQSSPSVLEKSIQSSDGPVTIGAICDELATLAPDEVTDILNHIGAVKKGVKVSVTIKE